MSPQGLPADSGPWSDDPAQHCGECGLIVVFSELWSGSGRTSATTDAVVADPGLGVDPEDAQRHAESHGIPDCDSHVVRCVMRT